MAGDEDTLMNDCKLVQFEGYINAKLSTCKDDDQKCVVLFAVLFIKKPNTY